MELNGSTIGISTYFSLDTQGNQKACLRLPMYVCSATQCRHFYKQLHVGLMSTNKHILKERAVKEKD